VKRVLHVMFPYQFGGEDLVMGFPCVVRFGVAFPLDQVLEFTPLAMMSMVSNGLDFVFLFAVDYLWRGFRKVDPMFLRFAISSQQTRMEHVMNGPGRRELELISDR
jgi:hypothetical protein